MREPINTERNARLRKNPVTRPRLVVIGLVACDPFAIGLVVISLRANEPFAMGLFVFTLFVSGPSSKPRSKKSVVSMIIGIKVETETKTDGISESPIAPGKRHNQSTVRNDPMADEGRNPHSDADTTLRWALPTAIRPAA